MKRTRLWSLFCILLLALGLSGCGADLNTFTWRVDAVPVNLDPQLAVSSEDVTAVMHLFRGLMRLDASGEPQPDAAESWTVSEDGKVYTFTLKEDLEWVWYRQRSQDYLRAVTAEDYVYGFRRVFDPETGSPYADDFSCIAGSDAVREGRADPSALGVEAVDERTVRITLETADPEFLTKLCLPGAMPCNREFFESTEGSYGLSSSSVMGTGPFYLYNWTSEGLFLRRGSSGGAINNLRLVLRDPEDTASPADRVRDGSSSAELSDTAAEDLAQIAYTSRTWGLLFNCGGEDNPLANVSVRQALASAAAGAELTLPLTPYDVLRLRRHMNNMPSEAFLNDFTRMRTFPDTGFPLPLLRMLEGPGEPCPFVTPGGCSVYENRPGACRFYPLGRGTKMGHEGVDERFFLVREPHCHGFDEGKEWTAQTWLASQELDEYNAANDRYMRLMAMVKATEKPLEPRMATMVILCLYQLDKFRELIEKMGIFRRVEITEERQKAVMESDEATLDFALDWLELVIFGQSEGLNKK